MVVTGGGVFFAVNGLRPDQRCLIVMTMLRNLGLRPWSSFSSAVNGDAISANSVVDPCRHEAIAGGERPLNAAIGVKGDWCRSSVAGEDQGVGGNF